MNKYLRLLRYDFPMHFVLFFTNWLPDNVVFIKLRGRLASPFFKSCGKNLGLARNITFYNPSTISLGSDVYFGYGCWVSGPFNVEDEVLFGPYCVIAPGNHQRSMNSFRFSELSEGVATVNHGAWLGAHSLLIGTRPILGEGSVLAANSTLINQAEPNSIYAGNPAKKIKNLN